MDWTPERCARFEQLWFDGVSESEMARLFGCSKNAIAGHRRAAGLTPRGSPIKRDQPPTPRRAKPLPRGASTLPALASLNE